MRRAALLGVLALAGCGDLQFERDERLSFTFPPERARLRTPVLVQWHIDKEDFRPSGFDGTADPRRGVFALFVDRSPMRPGRDLRSLAERDPYCLNAPGCPDRDWLAANGVYLTRRPSLALRGFPPGGGRRVGDLRRHEVTVVLLDARGRRIGEAAWTRSFYVPEPRS